MDHESAGRANLVDESAEGRAITARARDRQCVVRGSDNDPGGLAKIEGLTAVRLIARIGRCHGRNEVARVSPNPSAMLILLDTLDVGEKRDRRHVLDVKRRGRRG